MATELSLVWEKSLPGEGRLVLDNSTRRRSLPMVLSDARRWGEQRCGDSARGGACCLRLGVPRMRLLGTSVNKEVLHVCQPR
jgi:hypothetical protein